MKDRQEAFRVFGRRFRDEVMSGAVARDTHMKVCQGRPTCDYDGTGPDRPDCAMCDRFHVNAAGNLVPVPETGKAS